jgi:farnesyl diphosphate synthase
MFLEDLEKNGQEIQKHLHSYMATWDDIDVVAAMRHALNGGKRLRAFLAVKSAAVYDISIDQAIWPASAIEAIHAYSLVHDDLPCMDDDDLRRGMPTVHKKWNDATAVLAGDALQSLGFELVLNPSCSKKASLRSELARSLAKASGGQGMVLGQALDIVAESTKKPLDLEQITALQRGKTGALLGWSVMSGAILAEEDPTPLRHYAQAVGLAFQIADDVLDVQGDPEKVGKRLMKDATAGKATFVSLLGLEKAKVRSQELIDQACDSVSPLGKGALSLQQCAKFIISRDR